MDQFVVTPEVITVIAGVILSLGFSYIPKLNVKFAALDAEVKRSIMVGIMFVVTLGIFGGQYFGLWDAGFAMDKSGYVHLGFSFALAVIANQGAYSASPRTTAVKVAKELRKEGYPYPF